MSLTLPLELSPCNNVRRTCESLMNDDTNTDKIVTIDKRELKKLANEICQSIEKNKKKKKKKNDDSSSPAIVEWDEEGWHYTGMDYQRPYLRNNDGSDSEEERQRIERVALYVLALDSINFCFWPSSSNNDNNPLEYEHLAMALQRMACIDDIPPTNNNDNKKNCLEETSKDESKCKNVTNGIRIIQAEDSYAFSPQRLCQLTPDIFIKQLQPHLPSSFNTNDNGGDDTTSHYELDNIKERVRLLRELGHGLLHHYHGSASYMISQAHRRADSLVHILTSNFPGFRDSSIAPSNGTQIFFYKRAQICVGDLWASLHTSCHACNFIDMAKLTTFADYRIPQLLTTMGVLKYSQHLHTLVHSNTILPPGSNYEVYIRAATVVTVELLVKELQQTYNIHTMTAVKLDWYLWQLGEKCHQQHQLHPFHKVKTIFY